tara:strand:- start:1812 stop:1964 length:153 start_codon:yes stop_codon:yes gene_type:complete
MIKNILELLPFVEDGTENIKIAKGKYKLPETFREGYKQFKKELKWQKKSL